MNNSTLAKMLLYKIKMTVERLDDVEAVKGEMIDILNEIKQENRKRAEPTKIDYNEIAKLVELPSVKDGKDYVLTEDDKRFIASLVEIPKLKEPRNGVDGINGADGVNGEDYILTEDDIEDIAKEAASLAIASFEYDKVVEGLESLPTEKRLSYNELRDLPDLEKLKKGTSHKGIFTGNTGATKIKELLDVPSEYGTAGQILAVNATRTGMEFVDDGGISSVAWGDITGTLTDQTDLITEFSAALAGKSDVGHTHVKADITDFNDADYATAAQGALADTAVQSVVAGSNVTVDNTDPLNPIVSSSGGGTTINNYSSILAPQLFNPSGAGSTEDFTLSATDQVAFVTLNGVTLDDSEYSLTSATLTVMPDNGFEGVSDEVLVFQHSFSTSFTGGVIESYAQKTASYTVATTDVTIEAITTPGTTITLPTAVGITGQKFEIANSTGGNITVDTTSSETIYMPGGVVTAVILTDGEALTVKSNGTNYRSI